MAEVRYLLARRQEFAADCADVPQHNDLQHNERTTRHDPSHRLLPSTEGATFDHDYYRDKHVPLALRTWGMTEAEIDKGVDGPYVAAVHFKFESAEALQAAIAAPGSADVMADVANYTSIAPVMQTSEIVS